MITIPTSKPARAKAIAIGLGITSIVVSRFFPQHLGLLSELLLVLGIGGIGVGSAQIVRAPKSGGP